MEGVVWKCEVIDSILERGAEGCQFLNERGIGRAFFLRESICYEKETTADIIMRVIAGTQKGRRLLFSVESHIRPTSGRVKEALFSILGTRMIGASLLDLFAGTGAVGLEALSRGARQVVFVEQRAPSLRLLRENIKRCGSPPEATVIARDVWHFLRLPQGNSGTPFDILFADPPYQSGNIEELLSLVSQHGTLAPDGVLIVEHPSSAGLPSQVGRLLRFREAQYGDSALTFFDHAQPTR